MTVEAMTGGGGGGAQVVIPGDPGELARLATIYARAAGGMSDAAGQLQRSLGTAAGWEGAGAQAHALRAQALAGAHEVSRVALSLGSQALATYAVELAQAQQLAVQANAASASAAATATALAGALAKASTASTVSPDVPAEARFGTSPSPYQQAMTQSSQLQSTLDDQQGNAARLATQALDLAASAAARAGAAFSQVAQLTGTDHSSPDPFSAYLGATKGSARGAAAGGAGGGGGGRSALGTLSHDNDLAGWGLNAAGLYATGLTSIKTYEYALTHDSYGTAAGLENEAFNQWNTSDHGYFAWKSKVDDANASWRDMSAARKDMEESVAPAADDRSVLGTFGKAALGASIVSDGITIALPPPSYGPDGLLGGNTDRVLAGVNAAASGLALGDSMGVGLAATAMAIPGVDVVVIAALGATALYFAGEFVYSHWDTISDDAGNAAGWVGHELGHGASSVEHFFGGL